MGKVKGHLVTENDEVDVRKNNQKLNELFEDIYALQGG